MQLVIYLSKYKKIEDCTQTLDGMYFFAQMDGSSYQKMDATNGKCPLKPFASQITEMASNFPFFVVLFL